MGIPIPKGRKRKEGVTDPKQVQNLARPILLDLKAESDPLCFDPLPCGPIGVEVLPLLEWGLCPQGSGQLPSSLLKRRLWPLPPPFETEEAALMIPVWPEEQWEKSEGAG